MIREFANEVAEMITNETGMKVFVKDVTKNNGEVLTGLNIIDPESNVTPVIYVNSFVNRTPSEAVNEVLRIFAEHRMKPIQPSLFEDFEKVKENLTLRVVNRDRNNLEDYPVLPVVGDVVAIPVINILDGTARITKEMVSAWGVTEQELLKIATENVDRVIHPIISSINDVIKEMIEEQKRMGTISDEEYYMMSMQVGIMELPLYVVGNAQRVLGANQLCNKKILDAFHREFGDFIIIPSSIHELIFCPTKFGIDREELMQMISFVNANEVQPDEFLSDMAFIYDGTQLSVY